MQRTILKIILVILFCQGSLIIGKGQDEKCQSDKITLELERRYEKDQQIRKELMPVAMTYQKTGEGEMELFGIAMRMKQIDMDNQVFVDSLFEACNWPDDWPKAIHNALFIIIQHADLAFIKKYFPHVKEKAKKGILSAEDYALMLDRKLMGEGKMQRFGTQTFQGSNNKNYIWPVLEIDKLSDRRDSVGLPSMEMYMQLAKDSMGVQMTWDSTLTLEQARSMKQ